MNSGYIGKYTNWVPDVQGSQVQAEREDQWGEMPGEVVSFDPAKQTISVQPLYKKRLNGVPTTLPVLQEVPVRFPRMGGFVITTPVKPGDKVTLRPQMRNTEVYHAQNGEFAAADARSFSLSDMEAFLDGGESLSDPIPAFNNQNLELRSADGQFAIEMSEDGKFKLRGATDDWFALLHKIAELLASDTLTIKYGSSAGSGHALQHRAEYASIRDKLAGMKL
jgi:hypothetical protein